MAKLTKFTDHIAAKSAEYKQSPMMLHLMGQQALSRAGIEYYNIILFDDAALAIVDAEIERRLGGKRVNGKRVN